MNDYILASLIWEKDLKLSCVQNGMFSDVFTTSNSKIKKNNIIDLVVKSRFTKIESLKLIIKFTLSLKKAQYVFDKETTIFCDATLYHILKKEDKKHAIIICTDFYESYKKAYEDDLDFDVIQFIEYTKSLRNEYLKRYK